MVAGEIGGAAGHRQDRSAVSGAFAPDEFVQDPRSVPHSAREPAPEALSLDWRRECVFCPTRTSSEWR